MVGIKDISQRGLVFFRDTPHGVLILHENRVVAVHQKPPVDPVGILDGTCASRFC